MQRGNTKGKRSATRGKTLVLLLSILHYEVKTGDNMTDDFVIIE